MERRDKLCIVSKNDGAKPCWLSKSCVVIASGAKQSLPENGEGFVVGTCPEPVEGALRNDTILSLLRQLLSLLFFILTF